MNKVMLEKLLEAVRSGALNVGEAIEELKGLPFEDLGFATIDTHRSVRKGFAEVIYGEGKEVSQITAIVKSMLARKENVFITRLGKDKAARLKKTFPKGEWREVCGTFFIKSHAIKDTGKGAILVVCAGTSDVGVAEEAATTAEYMGNTVERMYDVGVAGIHRLLQRKKELFSANVLIVVAGMEGALPSVVAGLVSRPVIAVPTSVGYGTNLGGLTPLFAMLNSCATGITVVNIDNGFGAGYAAGLINKG